VTHMSDFVAPPGLKFSFNKLTFATMIYGNSALFDASALHRQTASAPQASIRAPISTDGSKVWKLIGATSALDDNSLYCNLLQTPPLAATCAIAEQDGKVVGWLSGYIPPEQPDTYFVWQVCVSDAARGQGLGKRLIADALARAGNAKLTQVSCTITGDNEASWALFGSVAKALNAQLQRAERFDRDSHFAGEHASEFAVSIGPIQRDRVASLAAA